MVARIMLITIALAGAGGVTRAEAQAPAVGTVAPNVTINDLAGKPVRIAMTAGKGAVVVEFWATWCEICRALLPEMRRAHQQYGDRVDFYGVDVTVNDPLNHVQRYVAAEHPPFMPLYDEHGTAVRAFGALSTSYVVIIGRDGRIAYTGDGSDQHITDELARVVGK